MSTLGQPLGAPEPEPLSECKPLALLDCAMQMRAMLREKTFRIAELELAIREATLHLAAESYTPAERVLKAAMVPARGRA